MSVINAYLTFNGDCRKAMLFYQKCLGGELFFQTVGKSPLSEKMPQEMKEAILHATLTKDGFVIMATDMVSSGGLIKGNAISLVLNCRSEGEIREQYAKLSQNGQQTHPLEKTFWGALFGGLTDQFGNQWLLQYQLQEAS
ncbi:VOC family protein [Flavobacterium humi]|uniref:VOC family protein n=1 Tax=Flavobacterium humi TaxID=2562683 RepID=A0A4Z0L437_9FLAO|nr:VOC family protein [Flavobacterium humi]TGD56709.1 VOC family protein [Flavobacterium humi]